MFLRQGRIEKCCFRERFSTFKGEKGS